MIASFWKSLSRYLKVLSCVSLLCDVLYLWESVGREAVSEGIYIAFFFFFLHAQRSVSSLGKCQEVVDYKSQSFTILQHLVSSRGYFLLLLGDHPQMECPAGSWEALTLSNCWVIPLKVIAISAESQGISVDFLSGWVISIDVWRDVAIHM